MKKTKSQVAYSIRIMNDNSSFTFEPGGLFKDEFENSKLTAEGLTIGEASRVRIHAKLDEFIDRYLGVSNEED